MNTTTPLDGAGVKDNAKLADAPNVWMYAVIAVCTVFVIAVTAALYNMCELFRTGPRPRRKINGETASTTGTLNSAVSVRVDKMASVSGTATPISSRYRDENIYKQLNSLPPSSLSPSPSPSSRHLHDIPDADTTSIVRVGVMSNVNAANIAATGGCGPHSAAAPGGMIATNSNNFNTPSTCGYPQPPPPPPPHDVAVHGPSCSGCGDHVVGGGGGGGDPSCNNGVAYLNSQDLETPVGLHG